MEMKIYNTLNKTKEKLIPLKQGQVGIYACGPTVYNYAHIGNMRTYIFEDTLKKTLSWLGYNVKHVINVTDVGHLVSDADDGADKMELSSAKEGKSAWDIARFYTKAFFNDFDALNCERPDIICKATNHIEDMINLVKRIEEKGFAYKTSDGIYFDTSKLSDYGKLAGQSHIDGIQEGKRIACNREKRNPTDFALWKFSPKDKKRQMKWESPWGEGFPGWHIECSAMSMKYLGETFDIHCGGVDHIPVHHSNEIAQSESATGKQFVNYWMHAEFLIMAKNDKMAKSAGNFITLNTLREENFDLLSYRYFCFSAHYKKQLEFTWTALGGAQKSLDNLRDLVLKAKKEVFARTVDIAGLKQLNDFERAISDDLNIPKALAVLWEALKDEKLNSAEKYSLAKKCDSVLSLDLDREPSTEELSVELMTLIKEREIARKSGDYRKSDEIRDKLKEKGVILEDTSKGTNWKKNRVVGD